MPRHALALAGLICAVSMTTIDQTIVALTAPTIQRDLGLTPDAVQWAVNAYLLATAALLPLGGRLADVYGHRRAVLAGIAAFAGTSLLCGLAPAGATAAPWLIAARAAQGAAGALMFPAAVGIVVQAFPAAHRGRAMALFFGITGAMTATGPIAGGYLTEWTWRAIFWVNLPIALAGFVLVAIAAPAPPRLPARIDWPGAAIVAAGLAACVLGLQQSAAWGWASPLTWAVLGVGGGLLAVFVALERRVRDPLVPLSAFGDRRLGIAIAATLIASAPFVSTFFFLSVYGQASLRLSAMDTGMLFLKFFLGFVIAAQIGSRLFDRAGGRPVLLIGGLLGAAGFGWLAAAAPHLDFDEHAFVNPQAAPIALAGAGVGFMLSAMSTAAVNRAIGASYGEVTALSQSARNLGGALGLAVFTSLVSRRLGTATSYADAVPAAFVAMAVAMGLVALLSVGYPSRSAEATADRTGPETALVPGGMA